MKKKIFIFGHTGYIGSYLLKYLNNEEFETHGRKIPRPENENLNNFYYKFIGDFLNQNENIFCIINSAGSIDCQTKEDYFFNSQFDVIFQKLIDERKIRTKYLSFNSTKIFNLFLFSSKVFFNRVGVKINGCATNVDNPAVADNIIHKTYKIIFNSFTNKVYIVD